LSGIYLTMLLTILSCNSKRIETTIKPTNEYSTHLCTWLKPYYAVEEEFHGNLPREVVSMMVRSDAEYNAVCLSIINKK
jgi:hypothetical protein